MKRIDSIVFGVFACILLPLESQPLCRFQEALRDNDVRWRGCLTQMVVRSRIRPTEAELTAIVQDRHGALRTRQS
jgi:hypothetical protein